MLSPHDISECDSQPKAQSIPPVVATKPAVVAPTKAKGPPIGLNFLQVRVQTLASLHKKPPPPVPPGIQPELLAKSTSGLLGKAARPPPRLKAFPTQEQLIHEQIEKQPGMSTKPPIKPAPSIVSAFLSGCEHHAQTACQVAPPAPPSLRTLHPHCVDSKSLGSAAMPPIKASPSSITPRMTNQDRIAPMPKKPAPPLPPQLQLQPQHSAVVLDPEARQPKRLTSEEQLQIPDVMLLTQTPRDISTQSAGQVLQSHDAEEEDAAVRQFQACSSTGGSASSEITNYPQVFDMTAGDTDDEAYRLTAPPDIHSPCSATGSGQAVYFQQTTGQSQPAQSVTHTAGQPLPSPLVLPPRTPSSDDESVPPWPWTGPEPVEGRQISFPGLGPAGSHTSAWTWTRNTWRDESVPGWPWTGPEPVEVRHISFRGVGSAGSHTSAWTWTRSTWRDESVPRWPWTGPEPVEVRHISFRGVGSAGSHTSAWTWTRNTWRTWWIWNATGGWSWTDPS